MEGLDGFSFWVGNPNPKSSEMELRVELPDLLLRLGWRMTFRDLPNNRFELDPGKQREIVMTLHRGSDFEKLQVERSNDRDIMVLVYADEMLIGGMTYRLDPEIRAPYNKREVATRGVDKRGCLGWLLALRRRLAGIFKAKHG